MEGPKIYLKDLRGEEKPVEEIEAENVKLIETAKIQLEQISVSLVDLAQKIIEEKPDTVIFLDKGARILATSFVQFLKDKMAPLPEVRFYNDDLLKRSYLHYQDKFAFPENFNEVVKQDFGPNKGKKVFFVDETFSFGKGASAIYSAVEDSGVDGYYFALTKDPKPLEDQKDWDEDDTHRVSYQKIQDTVEKMRKEGRLKIYENNIGYLFTKVAARLYVRDKERGATGPRYEIIPEDKVDEEYDYKPKPGKFPHARTYPTDWPGRDWKEYDRQVRLSNRKTVDELKKLILEALEKAA